MLSPLLSMERLGERAVARLERMEPQRRIPEGRICGGCAVLQLKEPTSPRDPVGRELGK